MSNKTQEIKTYQKVCHQVCSYILPEVKPNERSQKIGYTEQENVDKRTLEQVHASAFKIKYTKFCSAPAFFEGGKHSFMNKYFK